MSNTAYTIRGIDPQLWRQVKSAAALEGVTIRQYILNALRERTSQQEATTMRTFETATDMFGEASYNARDIDEAMQHYIDDVCRIFPEAREQFDSVRIRNGEVVSQYPDQAFEPGTVFLVESEN